MRPSPLRHPLAVLRTTIKLTQKELADLVGRAPRTIQAIELGHLPLSEELALRIASETGVDESWLLQGDTTIPPQMGRAVLAFAKERRPYGREDYEVQRALNETAVAPVEDLQEAGRQVSHGKVTLTLGQAKKVLELAEPVILQSMDGKLTGAIVALLKQTIRRPDALLVRWKLRRLVESLAEERKIELPMRDLAPPIKARKRRPKRATNIRVSGKPKT